MSRVLRALVLAIGLAAVLVVGACAILATTSTNSRFDAGKAHHTPEGFRNTYTPFTPGEGFWRWRWARLTDGRADPTPPGGWASVLLQVRTDAAFLKANRRVPTMTWLGHATVLVQVAGINIITDPVLSERASPVTWAGPHRHVPAPLAPADLPPIDVVFISHNHYDHLDRPTVLDIKARFPEATFLVPLGLADWFRAEGITRVVELDWWDRHAAHGLRFTFVPAQHWSRRGLTDTNRSLWGGLVIEAPADASRPWRFLYTGDTGYSRDFADIAARFPGGFDWAAIPIGAYEPRWFMRRQHVNPDEAVQIALDVGARRALGVHWGTFSLTDEPLDEPPKALARALAARGISADHFVTFAHGETRRMEPEP